MNIRRLKELREDKLYKQEYIAKLLGIKQQQYSEYEIGKRLIPINYLSLLADILDTSVDYLLDRTDIKEPYPLSMSEIILRENRKKEKVKN